MPVPVIYPKVSLETSTGRIARWLVAEGETVATGQLIFEIENDKTAVEVEAPAAGVIQGLTAEGEEVEVGAVVANVLVPGEAPVATPRPELVPTAAPHAAPAHSAPRAAPARRAPNPTPLARRIARERGVKLDGLTGTGPHGRVQKKDVLAWLEALSTPPADDAPLNAVWLRRGTGLPVVLLHGFSADLNNWRGLFAGVKPEFPVLALDLPAHGASPRAVPADLDALAARIETTLLAEGVTSAVLGGHSFGAAAAARIARRGRIAVRGLCLFAPAGLGPQIDGSFVDGILRARSAASLKPWLDWLVQDPATITAPFVQAVLAQRADDGLTAAMTAFAARFFPDGTQAARITDDLSALTVPLRVVFGRRDRVLPFAQTQSLPGNAALHALDDCGHMPHLERPALALRILTEVWRSAG